MASKGISFYRGDTVAIPFTFTGLNLTGMTVYFTVKDAKAIATDSTADTAAIIKKQTTVHVDAANGQTVISLTPTDTDVTPGKYVFDVQTKDANGAVQTRVAKPVPVEILSDVTRRTT